MERFDENYLDLVRGNLYEKYSTTSLKNKKSNNPNKLKTKVDDNAASTKNIISKRFKTKKETFKAKNKLKNKLKKKTKVKVLTFADSTDKNKAENISPTVSSERIRNRISTPFKSVTVPLKLKKKKLNTPFDLTDSQNSEEVFTIKPLQPALNGNDEITFYPESNQNIADSKLMEISKKIKRKKRKLSESDSPEIIVKRKKDKSFARKGVKLVFDDDLNDFDDSCQKQEDIFNKEQVQFDSSSDKAKPDSDVQSNPVIIQKETKAFKKKKIKIGPIEWEEEKLDDTLDTSLEYKTESNLNDTWENFIWSLNNVKNTEVARKKTKKQVSNLKKKVLKNDDNKANGKNRKTDDNADEVNNYDSSNWVLESNLGESVSSNTSKLKSNAFLSKEHKHISNKKNKKNKQKDLNSNQRNKNGVNNLKDLNNLADVKFKPKRDTSDIVEDTEVSDSCENEMIGVKGLKFQRFANLFFSADYEHNEPLHIPKKYFQCSQNDLEINWATEEISSPINNGETSNLNKINMFSPSKKHETNVKSKELSKNQIGFLSKNRQKSKKINIQDVKVLQKLPNCSNGVETSQDQEENFQENVALTPESPQETYEYTNNLSEVSEAVEPYDNNKTDISPSEDFEKLNQDIEDTKSKPVILTLKNNNKVVALNLNEEIHFYGLCFIEVLNGDIEILGASLNSNSGKRKFYSPRGASLLYVRNKSTLYSENDIMLKSLVSPELLNEDDVELTFKQHCAIFLCSELKEHYIDFIERHIPQKIFKTNNTLGPRVDFKLYGAWNKILTSEDWEEALEDVPEDSKIVISGGKGVGKSTFLRYAINFLLRRFDKIRVIDLDPGQSEFFPPGCISVITVDKEIFGNNFTHLLKPDSSILTHINIGLDVEKYIKSVQCLEETTKTMKVLPTLVNFPGFTHGFGKDITVKSIKLLKPSMVIQINSHQTSKNYKSDLTAHNVKQYLKHCQFTLSQDELDENIELFYRFVKFDELPRGNAWSLEPRQGRELNILAYFGHMMSESVKDLTSPDVKMYCINISALSITNLGGTMISPLAVNANLVALCSVVDNQSNIFCCYGYGLVRGVDPTTDTLVLITPEPLATLENVTHLVLSSIGTPPTLLMTTNGVKGHIPYVNVGKPEGFGVFSKRSYLPPKK